MITIRNQIPWGQIVMSDDVGSVRWDEHPPASFCRRNEALHRVMEISDQTRDALKLMNRIQ
ncbi:hypothetical protein Acor_70910 [Acrocarpospora corrugata]|uniref:Uncharacterized protein n=1 Tax=Acrocarpospora corrugata TaxID=35763 RepID=A0A5M3WD48_9ACTN|nr:hypothetical protein Acor_70910 [Acrocarpospora corrugata]